MIRGTLVLTLLAFAAPPSPMPEMECSPVSEAFVDHRNPEALAEPAEDAPSHQVPETQAHGFAQAWGAGDAQALGRTMNPSGIRLHLPGEDHTLIQPRQALAAIRSFLQRYPGGDASVTRVSLAGGDPRKAFAEIRWWVRPQGIGDPVMFTLFVAYSLESEQWWVTEIRVLH